MLGEVVELTAQTLCSMSQMFLDCCTAVKALNKLEEGLKYLVFIEEWKIYNNTTLTRGC